MTKTNYLLCRGDNCPLKMSCQLHFDWLNSEDDEESEMEPDYHDGYCIFLVPKPQYGN